jgi:hypothetical protein
MALTNFKSQTLWVKRIVIELADTVFRGPGDIDLGIEKLQEEVKRLAYRREQYLVAENNRLNEKLETKQ